MAKLSARGHRALVKVAKEQLLTPEQDPDIEWRRETLALRSDGKILIKRDVRFRARGTGLCDQAYFHSWGWGLTSPLRTLKAGATAESWAAGYVKHGYTIVK